MISAYLLNPIEVRHSMLIISPYEVKAKYATYGGILGKFISAFGRFAHSRVKNNITLNFCHNELSKKCSASQLPEAAAVIQTLLLVTLVLVVVLGNLAPQGSRILIFVFVHVKV